MVVDWFLIIAGFLLLFFGADALIRGSVRISVRSGISPLIIGLTVVAFGTSTPELFVSIKANLAGKGDIAIGNIVGSNIFNISIILGLAALLHPIKVKSQLVSQDIPVMIGSSLLFVVVTRDMTIQRVEGVLLFLMLITYIILNIHLARQGREVELCEEFEHHLPKENGRLFFDLLWIIAGIAILMTGSTLLVKGAVNLAKAAGISEAVIGLTLIAAGTGLPELATTLVATFKKETDMAVGNIVGSNIFNVLCIGGLSSVVKPLNAPDIEFTDLAVMMVLSVILIPLCWTGLRIARREGILLLASYAAYLYFIWPTPV